MHCLLSLCLQGLEFFNSPQINQLTELKSIQRKLNETRSHQLISKLVRWKVLQIFNDSQKSNFLPVDKNTRYYSETRQHTQLATLLECTCLYKSSKANLCIKKGDIKWQPCRGAILIGHQDNKVPYSAGLLQKSQCEFLHHFPIP